MHCSAAVIAIKCPPASGTLIADLDRNQEENDLPQNHDAEKHPERFLNENVIPLGWIRQTVRETERIATPLVLSAYTARERKQ
jgi:hypothetical protein